MVEFNLDRAPSAPTVSRPFYLSSLWSISKNPASSSSSPTSLSFNNWLSSHESFLHYSLCWFYYYSLNTIVFLRTVLPLKLAWAIFSLCFLQAAMMASRHSVDSGKLFVERKIVLELLPDGAAWMEKECSRSLIYVMLLTSASERFKVPFGFPSSSDWK